MRIGSGDDSGWIADFSKSRAHGRLDLAGAMEVSCNTYFAQAGLAAGADRLRAVVSRVPVASFSVPDSAGIHLAAAAIGQGRTLMTADQLSLTYSAIAGGGTTRRCGLLHERDGSLRCETITIGNEAHVATVARALRRVIASPHGTGVRAKEPEGAPFVVYGKTGTAEQERVRGEPGKGDPADHAWFAGFFEGAGGRRYAFAILLARAGTGGKAAAPLVPKLGALLAEHGYFDAVSLR